MSDPVRLARRYLQQENHSEHSNSQYQRSFSVPIPFELFNPYVVGALSSRLFAGYYALTFRNALRDDESLLRAIGDEGMMDTRVLAHKVVELFDTSDVEYYKNP